MIRNLIVAIAIALGFISAPALPISIPSVESVDEFEWSEFHADAMQEYEDEFTALFNSYETKWSKNGRLMIRQGDSGSFKFAKKGH
jgi:hypothetical protein